MKALLGNILLALAWLGLTGDFSPGNFLLGLVVGWAALFILGDIIHSHVYAHRVLAAGRLIGLFVWELAVSNLRVARDILTPTTRASPAIVGVPLEARSDLEILLLALLVTLTPGTVVLDVSEDRRRMYIFGMYASDPDGFRAKIKSTFERGVLAVTRGAPDGADADTGESGPGARS